MPSYYVDEDYPARPEIEKPLPEWSNWCGSESSTLETDVHVWRYALLVVLARKEEENDRQIKYDPDTPHNGSGDFMRIHTFTVKQGVGYFHKK